MIANNKSDVSLCPSPIPRARVEMRQAPMLFSINFSKQVGLVGHRDTEFDSKCRRLPEAQMTRNISRRLDRIESAIPLPITRERFVARVRQHIQRTGAGLESAIATLLTDLSNSQLASLGAEFEQVMFVRTSPRAIRQDSKYYGQTLSNLDFLNDDDETGILASNNRTLADRTSGRVSPQSQKERLRSGSYVRVDP